MSDPNFRVVSLQLTKAKPGHTIYTVSQHWGIHATDEEAIGAAVMRAETLKPGYSVAQWLVAAPFATTPPAADPDGELEQ